jgi:transcriptional regulator with XRE-family HTH domain
MIIDWSALAERLVRERARLALSQREVAREADVPQTLISRLERGERTRVELAQLNRVALVFGQSFPELLQDSPVRQWTTDVEGQHFAKAVADIALAAFRSEPLRPSFRPINP